MKSITYLRFLTAACILILGAVTQNTSPLLPSSLWDDVEALVYRGLVATKPSAPARTSRVVIVEADPGTIASYGWPLRRDAMRQFLETLEQQGRPWLVSLIHFRDTTASGSSTENRAALAIENKQLASAMANYGRFLGSSLAFRLGEELSTFQEERLLPRVLHSKYDDAQERLPYFAFMLLDDDLFVEAQAGFGLDSGFTFDDGQVCVPLYADTVGNPGAYTFPTSLLVAVHKMDPGRNQLANGLTLSQDPSTGDPFWPLECLPEPSLTTGAFLLQQQVPIVSLRDLIENRVPLDLTDKLVVLGSTEGWRFRGPESWGAGERLIPEHFIFARFADRLLGRETIGRKLHAIYHGSDTYSWLLGLGWALLTFWVRPLRMLAISGAVLATYLFQIYIPFLQGHLAFNPARLCFFLGATAVAGGAWFLTRLITAGTVIKFRDHIRIGFSATDNLERLIDVAAAACRGSLRQGHLKALHCHELMRLSATSANALSQASLPRVIGDIPVARCSWLPGKKGRRIVISGQERKGELRIYSQANAWTARVEDRVVAALAGEIIGPWHRIEFSTLKRHSDAQTLKLQADLELGRTVQQLTLPAQKHWPVPGGSAQIDFEPLTAMSGDWFQAFHRADGTLTVLAIGDVVGKGPSAALATTVIAAEWKRAAIYWEHEPPDTDKFLEALHNTLFNLFQGKQNTTISLVVVTAAETRCLRCGSPPWLLFDTPTNCRLVARGPSQLLGYSKDYSPPREETLVPAGPSTLLAYSDGVFATSVEVQAARKVLTTRTPAVWDFAYLKRENLISTAEDDQTLLCLHFPRR